ncbi:MAG TPA: NADPH:quinone oxidoreductase family protein [Acidimicrobiales bacterium]|nr:NADPH:quinone oxidoreductase family protein [Acidimicrobiales bacterium]
MRAAVVEAWGEPESVVVEDLDDPEPGPGEVLVRVQSAAVNYPDVLIAANKYQVSIPPPFTPGSEWAGVVEALGPGVSTLRVGDRVTGGGFVGAFAQKLVAPATVARIPDGASFDAAASFSVVYRTAYTVLRSVAEVRPGEWVAVLGAAGGVGLATVDLAVVLGARVLAAASSADKLAVCAERGAAALVDYTCEPLKDRIKELTGGGADVVVDPVGGSHAEQALRATHYGSRFVTVGYASGEIPRIPLNLVLLKGVRVMGYEARTFGSNEPALAARDRREVDDLFAAGRISPYVSAVYGLDEVGAALRHVGDRRAIGKVIIHPWE